jgi:hypothetical protein
MDDRVKVLVIEINKNILKLWKDKYFNGDNEKFENEIYKTVATDVSVLDSDTYEEEKIYTMTFATQFITDEDLTKIIKNIKNIIPIESYWLEW